MKSSHRGLISGGKKVTPGQTTSTGDPFNIGPYSPTEQNTVWPDGDTLRNNGGAHQIPLRNAVTTPARDFLGTGNILRRLTDEDGIDYLAIYPDPTLWAGQGYVWLAGSDLNAGQQAFVLDPATAPDGAGEAATLSGATTANYICYIMAKIPEGAVGQEYLGIDINGYWYEVDNPAAANRASIGISIDALYSAVMDAQGDTVVPGWTSPINTTNSYGRVIRAFAVNGSSPSTWYAADSGTGNTETGSNTVTGTVDTVHAVAADPVSIALGTIADSGIYQLGIHNYGTTTITAGELKRVCDFMLATGKLPYWWS